MNIFRRFNKKSWSSKFSYDESYQFGYLLKGELEFNKSICKLSRKNYDNYINKNSPKSTKTAFRKKSIVLINGEIRNSEKFIKWANIIKNFSYIYFFTDKLSYSKIEKIHRDHLEKISSGFIFSEDDNYYQENIKRECFHPNMYQWLKFRQSLLTWRKEWEEIGARTIIRMRSDISFLNPYLLEHQIKQGFFGFVDKGMIQLRSDMIFAFEISDIPLLAGFYDSIFSFYLSDDWINYPYLPLDPELIIRARGNAKIEWNNFPKKYVGTNPTKKQFFDRICYFYNELLHDFNNYSFLKNFNFRQKKDIFGDLSSVRIQPQNIFASERCFAHYLVSKGFLISSHNHVFSGQIIRNGNNKKRFLRNLFNF